MYCPLDGGAGDRLDAVHGRMAESLDADPLKSDMVKSYRQCSNPLGKRYFKGGAGLVGTASDYLRFAQTMVNGGEVDGRRYLSRKTVEFMLSQHTVGMGGTTIGTTDSGYGFGLGFGVRRDEGMGNRCCATARVLRFRWTDCAKRAVLWRLRALMLHGSMVYRWLKPVPYQPSRG